MRVVLATGSGKSAVIAHAFARLLKSGYARRPLYLTSRLEMAHQMLAVLRSLDLGEDGPLGDTHYVQLLRSATELGNRDGTVTIATPSMLRSSARKGTVPAFDLIALDDLDGGVDWPSTSMARLVDRFHATVIAFSSALRPEGGSLGPPVFTYDFRDALADGVLFDTSQQEPLDRGGVWPAFDPQDPIHSQRRVFLGGVTQDQDAIQRLADKLRAAGIRVADTAPVMPPDIAPGDVFVAVLSPNSVKTPLVDDHVSQSLERRDVDVIPAVIEYCAVPARLAGRLPVDVTARADGLLRRLQASGMVDLDTLDPARFERLMADLLSRLCFTLHPTMPAQGGDSGVDFVATFQDADGFGIDTQYLIQVKRTRSSFRDVAQLVQLVREAGPLWRGLVVTNGHLTSVTGKRLARIREEGTKVQVIDGPRLRSLLLRHPDLIAGHFARGLLR